MVFVSRGKIVKLKATGLLDKYNLPKITLDNLIYIIEDNGFEIIEFGKPNSSSSTIIKELKLEKYAKSRNAFAYQLGSAKFVFLFEDLSAEEKLLALAHEAGHIFCSHLKEGNIEYSVEEEFEANEFTHYILHPSYMYMVKQWVVERKTAVTISIVVLALICVCAIVFTQIQKANAYYGDYYITETGEKYHKKDCIFIKDKKRVERLTEGDYNSGEYDPCQICLPED